MTSCSAHDHTQEPRPFAVVAGDPESSVIIHVPHASRAVPAAVRAGIYLDDAALERELDAMTDACTDVIARQVAERARVRPWLFVNQRSPLVVDPEPPTVHTGTSDGFVLRDPAGDGLPELFASYAEPYAAAFTELVEQCLQATGQVAIVDLHSYSLTPLRSEPARGAPRPEVSLGTDDFHTGAELITSAHAAFGHFDVAQDAPFHGCYVPSAHYRQRHEVQALAIELRRDLYLDDDLALVEPAIEPIVEALSALLNDVDDGLVEDTA